MLASQFGCHCAARAGSFDGVSLNMAPLALSKHFLLCRYCHKHYDQNKDGNKDVSGDPGPREHACLPLSPSAFRMSSGLAAGDTV